MKFLFILVYIINNYLTREFKKAHPYLARCVGHVAKSHSQLVIAKVRTEQVIIPHICTKGVIPTE